MEMYWNEFRECTLMLVDYIITCVILQTNVTKYGDTMGVTVYGTPIHYFRSTRTEETPCCILVQFVVDVVFTAGEAPCC